jgi:3',5'-cyclic AMP phosphodiesterase CpdA
MSREATLIGQITDLHILAERARAYGVADTSSALEALEDYLFSMSPPLDALVMTGDLADAGEPGAYGFIAKVFSRWKVPVLALPGNHDSKEALRDKLGDLCPAKNNSDLSYARSLGKLRLIMLDTAVEARHGGHLGKSGALFLEEELLRSRDCLAFVFCHHPPFASGLGSLDEPFEGRERLLGALARHPKNLALASGHLHRPMAAKVQLNGSGEILATVAPPAAMPIDLELTPDGGQKFTLGAPGFAIHRLEGGRLATHFGTVPGAWPGTGPHYFA